MDGIISTIFLFLGPLTGLILLLGIFSKMSQFKRIWMLLIGLCLLSMPLIYFYLGNISYKKCRRQVLGTYFLNKDPKSHLTLYNDGSYVLDTNRYFKNAGRGKWNIEVVDLPYLELTFVNNNVEQFEISYTDEVTMLKYGIMGEKTSIRFRKITLKN